MSDQRTTEVEGWVVVDHRGLRNINDVAMIESTAWNNVCSEADRRGMAKKGWRAVRVKVTLLDKPQE